MAQWVKNLTAVDRVTVEVWVQPLSLAQWASIATARAQVTATAQIHSLAWELPYATVVAIKNKKNRKEEFLLWRRGNEFNWHPRGCGFSPWPRSVGWGSGIAVS